jgi:hypothetical protein
MQKREKTFEAIRDLFIFESQIRPVILVVEDLHWIDKTSEAFLEWRSRTGTERANNRQDFRKSIIY